MPVKKSSVVSRQSSDKKTVASLAVPMYTLEGVENGTLSLPEDIFGSEINETLLAQAARVYLNNQKSHSSNTKTRSEVRGSTRKIRAQKGTGGARHGSVRAPIFVGGGIALGPKYRKVVLDLPKKMKTAALISALSSKFKDGEIVGITGADKALGKTKEVQPLIKKLAKKNLLLVLDEKEDKLKRAVKNLPKVVTVNASQLNILEVFRSGLLVLSKGALGSLELRMKNSEEKKLSQGTKKA